MWWIASAHAGLSLEGDPALGAEATVTLTEDSEGAPVVGATVRAIYRPGLTDSSEVAVGITDARGQVAWVPDQPGTVSLVADDATLPMVVAWPSPPLGTVVMILLVLVLALGGVGYGLRSDTR